MIFVTLGTQDMPFKRILDYLENSNIEDEIIVQAGYTEYKSNKLKIFAYLDKDSFDDYVKKADYVICHAGIGSIVGAISKDKKVLAVPRLAKYGEHHNDHQLQIADVYKQKGYILVMSEDDSFDEKFNELKEFVPNKFVPNNEIFVQKLKDYIMLKR